MPWTLAFILKTWMEREDWRERNEASCGLATVDGAREWVRPASMSWKLIAAEVTVRETQCKDDHVICMRIK